ncbi:MFS general substrate transporter [Myriangium duriaei CBS 260.36]|uniref:MFS general substrate transporter n=1 Tax=Myriangium duriaei CBS 260.36 TaxID=1168546 RepID=A0A9P4ITW0_9PEZI|nr:MFS general substrate transporter [Myriangium duriaei CBS 260.36]
MAEKTAQDSRRRWKSLFARGGGQEEKEQKIEKWSMGILNDRRTIAVPGSVLLLAKERNEPLGLSNAPARTSASSLPVYHQPQPQPEPPPEDDDEQKKTSDGKIILEPQPEDSANDPLNWPTWRRDAALLSLGLYCMVGGGITPLLAAGFTNVATDYHIQVSRVSLTTGLYMMGLGLGSVIFSPTAILYGKRPVYLFSVILFASSAVWCAKSPNFTSLILARIFQGIAVSPVECLPSATIAEIFFLHERAYRIGIYTLLLLGGKNLVPLVSAAVINSLGWRWAFWIVAIVVGFCGILLFLFVPETFWDRAPLPKKPKKVRSRPSFFRSLSSRHDLPPAPHVEEPPTPLSPPTSPTRVPKHAHVGFAPEPESHHANEHDHNTTLPIDSTPATPQPSTPVKPRTPDTSRPPSSGFPLASPRSILSPDVQSPLSQHDTSDTASSHRSSIISSRPRGLHYTRALRSQPPRTFVSQLKPYHGRLHRDSWLRVCVRPFILFSYPAVLYSATLYACSVGWLIVISESVAVIYRDKHRYNFSALQTGLVYISPFVGGILGTAVAGRVSDVIVKAMARRNGGLYEPEFRLVMAIPIAITTVIGLMGFGWSAQVRDAWIVPTLFFGAVSFGCSLGSTTAITFCVDSYRQYAGEALVTLNFSKNVLHGLVWSLFVTEWITADGSKSVYIWIGVIQLLLLVATVPMYIYGKRGRMWTVRRNFMEKF